MNQQVLLQKLSIIFKAWFLYPILRLSNRYFMLKSEGIICILMRFWQRIFTQKCLVCCSCTSVASWPVKSVYNSFLTYHWMNNHSKGACKQANEHCSWKPNCMALLWNALYFTLLIWDEAVFSGDKQIIVSTKITFSLGYLTFDRR